MELKITHDGINSIGVLVGIGLGAASLWLQLSPKSEALVIDGGEWISTNEPLAFKSTAPSASWQSHFGRTVILESYGQ